MWTTRSPGFTDDKRVGGDYQTFKGAKNECATLQWGGYKDWRLANIDDYKWYIKNARYDEGVILTTLHTIK